jgi:hypothetical protein
MHPGDVEVLEPAAQVPQIRASVGVAARECAGWGVMVVGRGQLPARSRNLGRRLHVLGYERLSPWQPEPHGFGCKVERIIR